MSRPAVCAKSWIVFASGTARPAIERTAARFVTESGVCLWHAVRCSGGAVDDVRSGLRLLGKHPGFATVAVVMLALAIGGTTALYSVIDAVLVRPLPYHRPQKLVALHDTFSQRDVPMSILELDEYRKDSGAFDALGAYLLVDGNLTGGDRPERLWSAGVTPEYFRVLG